MSVHSSKPGPRLVVSIVSHGHGPLVQDMLLQLARWSASSITKVVLVQNIPEPVPAAPSEGWPFDLKMIANETPHGFGANHNRALRDVIEDFVCVLNPDVALVGRDPFPEL